MAKITNESRDLFNSRIQTYKDKINVSLEKEKSILALISRDQTGNAYKKLVLCEEMIYIATIWITINDLSVELLGTKNNDALNDARKTLYKAIIYLEEVVSNFIDVQYADLDDRLKEISNTPIEKRYFIVRKLGLAIDLLINAFGENSKWKWSFVEIQGRFATVAKNLIDMKQASKDFYEPSSPDYDTSVLYIRTIKKLLGQSATQYRDRYELSTHRVDDMRLGINYLLALRRISVLFGEAEEAEELKKKAQVWKEKMEKDHKSGISR